MFRLGKADALSLGNALIDAVEHMDEQEIETPMAIERHEEGLFPLPEVVSGENTILVVESD